MVIKVSKCFDEFQCRRTTYDWATLIAKFLMRFCPVGMELYLRYFKRGTWKQTNRKKITSFFQTILRKKSMQILWYVFSDIVHHSLCGVFRFTHATWGICNKRFLIYLSCVLVTDPLISTVGIKLHHISAIISHSYILIYIIILPPRNFHTKRQFLEAIAP